MALFGFVIVAWLAVGLVVAPLVGAGLARATAAQSEASE